MTAPALPLSAQPALDDIVSALAWEANWTALPNLFLELADAQSVIEHEGNVRHEDAGRCVNDLEWCPTCRHIVEDRADTALVAINTYRPPSRPNARYCRACHRAAGRAVPA